MVLVILVMLMNNHDVSIGSYLEVLAGTFDVSPPDNICPLIQPVYMTIHSLELES